MNESITIGRIIGIRIKIHYTWFIVFGLVMISLATAYFPKEYEALSRLSYWIPAGITTVMLFASVLLHELAHSWVAQKNGITIRGITLFIFGGVAELTGEPPTAKAEFKIAIAGPLMSFALAGVFYLIGATIQMGIEAYSTVKYLSYINVILALFNLAPGFPLDGGRVLRAAIWKFTGDLKKATKTASVIGQGFAFLLIFWGIMEMFGGHLFNGLWLIVIGFFLDHASKSSYQQLLLKRMLSGIKIGAIMEKDVITVDQKTNLKNLVDDYFFKYRYSSFPVMDGERLVGIISINNVKDIHPEKWSYTDVYDIMQKIHEGLVVSDDEDAVNVLDRMLRNNVRKLVVSHGDRIKGIVTLQDIMKLFSIKTDLGGP
ncbi:MAG: site-2 protease family protein [Nitrospirota bacterium]